MMFKNFWSNAEINEFYKNHPLLVKIEEHEKCWVIRFTNGRVDFCEKDENFVPDPSIGVRV
jgi:hypothetical protein